MWHTDHFIPSFSPPFLLSSPLSDNDSTETGFFEETQYRYTANASDPSCITAYILWQHGNYKFHSNGSITLYPWGQDGRIQVQEPCATESNILTYYDQQVSFFFSFLGGSCYNWLDQGNVGNLIPLPLPLPLPFLFSSFSSPLPFARPFTWTGESQWIQSKAIMH